MFIYSTQLIILEFSFKQLLKDNTLTLINVLKEFMSLYFNNACNTALREILNHRSYCFQVNKETNTINFININSISKETLFYNKVIISINNLKGLFKELINNSNSLLKEVFLLNILKYKYKEITLKEFFKVKDKSLITLFKCFKDFSFNSTLNNTFLKNEIFKNNSLFSRFFIIKDPRNLKLNTKEVNSYLRNLKQFKKYCLLLIYLTIGLPLVRSVNQPPAAFGCQPPALCTQCIRTVLRTALHR